MNLALIKNKTVVNVIVVDGDGSVFLTENKVWAAQFDAHVPVDPNKVRCLIGDTYADGKFKTPPASKEK